MGCFVTSQSLYGVAFLYHYHTHTHTYTHKAALTSLTPYASQPTHTFINETSNLKPQTMNIN